MSNLKEQLIKLGSTNPELRPHIKPLLDSLATKTATAKMVKNFDTFGGHRLELRDSGRIIPDTYVGFEKERSVGLEDFDENQLNKLVYDFSTRLERLEKKFKIGTHRGGEGMTSVHIKTDWHSLINKIRFDTEAFWGVDVWIDDRVKLTPREKKQLDDAIKGFLRDLAKAVNDIVDSLNQMYQGPVRNPFKVRWL